MVYVQIRTSIHVSWHNGIHNVYINLHLEGGGGGGGVLEYICIYKLTFGVV